VCMVMEIRFWDGEVNGGWGWGVEIGNWKLETGNWQLAIGERGVAIDPWGWDRY
jgi:hypothetical protein